MITPLATAWVDVSRSFRVKTFVSVAKIRTPRTVPTIVPRPPHFLSDVARALDTERLEPGRGIIPADLDAAADLARVTIEPGDVLLVRTGQAQFYRNRQRTEYANGSLLDADAYRATLG